MNAVEIIEKIKRDGFYKAENFLDKNNLIIVEKILNKRILKKNVSKGEVGTFFYRSRNKVFLLNKLLKLQILYFLDCLKLINLTKKLHLKPLADKILGTKTKLYSIDSYFSPKSDEPVLDWHFDQSYSGKSDVKKFYDPQDAALKFFVYLTPVDLDNGCLGYIPGSNKIAYHLKKGIFEGSLEYKPYWKLIDFRNVLKNPVYSSYIEKKIGIDLIKKFMEDTKFVETPPYTTDKFYNKLDKGGAIIFDESGAHIGSKPSKHDRLVLRFVYKISTASN